MLDRRLSVAPMMGCTDRHCRHLLRLIARRPLLYSEMITTGALLHGDAAQHLAHRDDAPSAFQLGGSDPRALAACARLVADAGYDEVNLNCGCPSDKVQEGGIGACLMAQPELVADCFAAMQEAAPIPVTVKSRIGIDQQDSYDFFARFVHCLYAAGCRVFIVHARAAILSGMSPKDNREIPPLRYGYVARMQAELPDATLVLNGGIKTCGQALALLGAHRGVMLGRAPYAQPMLLAELAQALDGGGPAPSPFDVFARYREYMAEELEAGTPLRQMAKHLFGLFAGLPGARAFRRHLSERMHSPGAGLATLDEAARLLTPDGLAAPGEAFQAEARRLA